jgi:hypothetical protein
MEKDQILMNLARFVDVCGIPATSDEDTTLQPGCSIVPDQVVLGGGQAQVSNQQQTPNITANLSGVVVKAISFQDQNQWTQTWSVTPVTDSADLERLRALYRYAISVEKVDSKGTPLYSLNDFIDTYSAALVKTVDSSGRVPAILNVKADPGGQPRAITVDTLPLVLPGGPIPNQFPKWEFHSSMDQWRYPLPVKKWLCWDRKLSAEEAKLFKPVAHLYGGHTFYVVNQDFENVLMWVFGATPNTSGGSSKGGGAGQGKGPAGFLYNAQ